MSERLTPEYEKIIRDIIKETYGDDSYPEMTTIGLSTSRTLLAEIDRLRTEAYVDGKQFGSLVLEHDTLKANYSELCESYVELEIKYKQTFKQWLPLASENKKLTEEIDALRADRDAAINGHLSMEGQLKDLINERESLSIDVANLTGEVGQLKANIKVLTASRDKLKAENEKLNTESEHTSNTSLSIAKENVKLKIQTVKLEARIKEAQMGLQSIHDSLITAQLNLNKKSTND